MVKTMQVRRRSTALYLLVLTDVSDGTEDGNISFKVMDDGTVEDRLALKAEIKLCLWGKM